MTEPRDLKPSPDPAGSIPYLPTDLPPGVTLARLCEAVWAAESKFGLLDWEVNGVKPWQAGRFSVFQSLSSAMGLFEHTPDETPAEWSGRVGYHARLLRGALTHNPFAGFGQYDAMVFESPRSASIGGITGCVYTHALADSLTRAGKRVQLLDTQLAGVHTKSPDVRRCFTDAIGLESGLRFRLSRWKPTVADQAVLGQAEEYLRDRLETRVDLRGLLWPGVPRFLASYAVYRRLFELRRPSEIYCVCAHGNLGALVAAGRRLGVRVTEVQHAVVSAHHLGYSYPEQSASRRLEYFPDRFLAWDRNWNQLPPLPCPVERIAPHWTPLTLAHQGVARTKGLMVVLSQPPIARRLAQALLDRKAELQRFEVVVKPHPAELRDPTLRAMFAMLSGEKNFRVAVDEPLYALLPRAEYQIGVYSTAIYEGIDLGCRTLLVPLPGIEHLTHLISSGKAQWLDDFLSAR